MCFACGAIDKPVDRLMAGIEGLILALHAARDALRRPLLHNKHRGNIVPQPPLPRDFAATPSSSRRQRARRVRQIAPTRLLIAFYFTTDR